jgi:hypothetical protein
MSDIGRISKLEVRCPCGTVYETADTYLQYRQHCKIHVGQKNGNSTPQTSKNSSSTDATSIASASSPKPVACSCDRALQDHNALAEHGSCCAVDKQRTETPSQPLDSTQVTNTELSVSSVVAAGSPTSSITSSAKNLQCICGQTFVNEKQLNNHLQYSKTHRTNKSGAALKSKVTAPLWMPFSASNAIPYPIPLASGPLPGIVSSSIPSKVSLLGYTCGQVLERKQVLDLHKRDDHQQPNQPPPGSELMDALLVSSFASLDLGLIVVQSEHPVARFGCGCGKNFTSEGLLEHHKLVMRSLSWPAGGGVRDKEFNTPRPNYQEVEYLREMAAAQARQYSNAG